MTIITTNEGSIILNGQNSMPKGLFAIKKIGDAVTITFDSQNRWDISLPASIDGEDVTSLEDLVSKLSAFSRGGGSGTGAVESVTGNLVTGSAENPVIDFPIGTDREVPLYISGELVNGRLGWKQFSDLPTPPNFSNGFLTGTAFQQDGSALYGFIEWALDEQNQATVKPNAVPAYNPGIIGTGGGTLPVADGIKDTDAVNVSQLNTRIPKPPASGTFNLRVVEGTVSWVAE